MPNPFPRAVRRQPGRPRPLLLPALCSVALAGACGDLDEGPRPETRAPDAPTAPPQVPQEDGPPAEDIRDAPSADGLRQDPGAAEPAERDEDPDAAQSELPPALRDTFRIVDDRPRQHGDRVVPSVVQHVATGLDFLYVPGGTFTLGSDADDPDRFDDERPPRRIRIGGFYLSATETTWAAWQAGGGTAGDGLGDDHPVQGIHWYEARDWCSANGLALPTEAQWEYAASGPRDDLYPWGHDSRVIGRANAAGTNDVDLWLQTAPVGSFPEGTAWCGALDLAGNVMEWCRDGWLGDHTQVERDALDPVFEPEGDAPAVERLVRGGSYETDTPHYFRGAYRNALLPTLAGGNLGFRAVVPPFE